MNCFRQKAPSRQKKCKRVFSFPYNLSFNHFLRSNHLFFGWICFFFFWHLQNIGWYKLPLAASVEIWYCFDIQNSQMTYVRAIRDVTFIFLTIFFCLSYFCFIIISLLLIILLMGKMTNHKTYESLTHNLLFVFLFILSFDIF